jgi:hypothetical protein
MTTELKKKRIGAREDPFPSGFGKPSLVARGSPFSAYTDDEYIPWGICGWLWDGVAWLYMTTSANCGSMEGLGRCSRCHSAWFCSVKCQKAYWPFHREWCKKNDFADALEAEQPKFAKWMRKHGKVAVLKDGERTMGVVAGWGRNVQR